MTFDQIQSFYWVAILGTYRLAAEKQNTTQPAISARIKALETSLGVELFDRSGHRVALTPLGRQFLGHAETLLEFRGKALRDIGLADPVAGTIRIGASDTVAVTWFPEFMSYLRAQFPNAVFEAHVEVSYRLREALIQRDLDIAFMVGPVSHTDLQSTQLCAYPSGFIVSPKLGIPADRVFGINDIARMTIFTFDRVTQPHQDLRAALSKAEITSHRISPANTLQSIVLLVEQGLGAGYLQLSAVERELASGQLMQLKTDFVMPETSFCVAHPKIAGSIAASEIARGAQDFLRIQTSVQRIRLLC
ncbi:LysR family transcriptional regulator [Seohaeicola zhoushanensis]